MITQDCKILFATVSRSSLDKAGWYAEMEGDSSCLLDMERVLESEFIDLPDDLATAFKLAEADGAHFIHLSR